MTKITIGPLLQCSFLGPTLLSLLNSQIDPALDCPKIILRSFFNGSLIVSFPFRFGILCSSIFYGPACFEAEVHICNNYNLD